MLTWVEIDFQAIHHNLKQFRKLIGPDILLMPVIKRNAYGHGFLEAARIVGDSPLVDRVCVAGLDEAITLLKNGFKKPIIILSFYELESPDISLAIKKGVAFPIYTKEQVTSLNTLASALGKRAIVHLKIDTGTSRLGILPDEAVRFGQFLKQQKNLNWEGLWSHFSSSEEDSIETNRQIKLFNQVIANLKKEGIDPPIKHMACTASTILHPDSRHQAVRVGLGTYGLYPSAACQTKIKLRPALSWHTKLIQIKDIPAATAISYGRTHKVKRPTRLGVLPIGYYDGYDRRFSSTAEVLVKGHACHVLGRICMNLTMIDLTDVPGSIKVGERATLIGQQGKNSVTADNLADWSKTINYEIVDRINPLLPRIVT